MTDCEGWRCPDCEQDEDEECLHCADRVMVGIQPCGLHDAEIRKVFREGQDPMDVMRSRRVDEGGLVDEADIDNTVLPIRNKP